MAVLFVKTFGHAGTPVPANWMAMAPWQDRLATVWFPKYPRSVSRGSRLVYYAAGRQRFCAVVEVIADEPTDTGSDRWPYQLAVRPLVAIAADDYAPSLADVGFDPLRVRRQSHIRLTEEEYHRIVEAIVLAAATVTRLPRGSNAKAA
ncbi:MAG: hypothetical protein ACR2JH_00975 [Solirubrobacteraceae bacterium]